MNIVAVASKKRSEDTFSRELAEVWIGADQKKLRFGFSEPTVGYVSGEKFCKSATLRPDACNCLCRLELFRDAEESYTKFGREKLLYCI